MTEYRNIGIIHHGLLPEAVKLAGLLQSRYAADRQWWSATQDTLASNTHQLQTTDLIVTIGGDGTILRGVHEAAPRGIPVLGVNMGRVGFMSEIDAGDAVDGLAWYLEGNARLDERYMLQAEISGERQTVLHALNDVTVARGAELRVIEVETLVDGVHLADYRGDGLVVATATGSTGYTLSLGGPVMDPASEDYLVKPIATHMSQFGGVVLRSTTTLELTVHCSSPATISADGFIDRSLEDGETVRISHASIKATFLRKRPRTAFWSDLSRRLGMRVSPLPRVTE
ncbi:MAG: NAD(+)/NADH kinase [Chloroflexi bacterium]|nr:NAD(+)/NADH kinase [Chloroflexota bacterium]